MSVITENGEEIIEVSVDELPTLVRKAYELSVPQGLGFLHARDGELDQESVDEIITRGEKDPFLAVSMDYVHGRSCKFGVRRSEVRDFESPLTISYPWYDHSKDDWDQLITALAAYRNLRDATQ